MQQQPVRHENRNTLMRVREGMSVYDYEGDHIGSVRTIYLGASPVEAGDYEMPAPTTSDVPDRNESFIENVAEAFADYDQIPEELRERLLHDGYLRIDRGGLFSTDGFVLPEQIASITQDKVHLNIDKDGVIAP
jgi:hypothetical protein